MEQVDNAEEWSIDHYARDMSEHILNYVFNTGKFPNVQFTEGSVDPETQPQLVNNTMVVAVPPEIDRLQFIFALEKNYQNGVNLEIKYGYSNSQCKISIFKPNVTSHDGALNAVKILNQQNKDQPTYYRLVQKDNNYLIMACTAASLEEKKMIQNQYEAGNNYNYRSFENKTLSDSGPQDAKKTYLRALRHFAVTGKMPEGATEQAPDENDTDERALHTACAILEKYNDDSRQSLLKISLVALLSKSNLPQEETLTEFAKCLVHVVSKINDTNNDMKSIEKELEKERNKNFKLELLHDVYHLFDNIFNRGGYYNCNEEFESEDIYNLDSDIDKLVEGKMYKPNIELPQPLANNLNYNGIHYDSGLKSVKIPKDACTRDNGRFKFEGKTRLTNDEGEYLVFNLNGKQIEVPWVNVDDEENYEVHCCLDTNADFQENDFIIEVPKNKQKAINNTLDIKELIENALPVQNNSYQPGSPANLEQQQVISSFANSGQQSNNIILSRTYNPSIISNTNTLQDPSNNSHQQSSPVLGYSSAPLPIPSSISSATPHLSAPQIVTNVSGSGIINESQQLDNTEHQNIDDPEDVLYSEIFQSSIGGETIDPATTQYNSLVEYGNPVVTTGNSFVKSQTAGIDPTPNVLIPTITGGNNGQSNGQQFVSKSQNFNVNNLIDNPTIYQTQYGNNINANNNTQNSINNNTTINGNRNFSELMKTIAEAKNVENNNVERQEEVGNPDLAQIAEARSASISSQVNNISNNGNQILFSGMNQNYDYDYKNLNNGKILNATNNQIFGTITTL